MAKQVIVEAGKELREGTVLFWATGGNSGENVHPPRLERGGQFFTLSPSGNGPIVLGDGLVLGCQSAMVVTVE